MSFPDEVTLVDDLAANVDYSLISREKSKAIRSDAARDLGTPRTLVISHESKGVGMAATDRHLVRLNLVEEDTGSEDYAVVNSSVYVVLETPRRIITETMVQDMVTQLKGFLTAANVTKLLHGEP